MDHNIDVTAKELAGKDQGNSNCSSTEQRSPNQMVGDCSNTLNAVMITAALLATVTFAAMMLPPGGFVPPQSNASIRNLNVTALEDADVGHVVLRMAGHDGMVTPLLVFLYLSFSLALCSLMLSLVAIDLEKERMETGYLCCCCGLSGLADWRATYLLANLTLVGSALCAYGAFACAAFINFNFRLDVVIKCTAVTGSMVAVCMLWAVFGPFSFNRRITRMYDKRIGAIPVYGYTCGGPWWVMTEGRQERELQRYQINSRCKNGFKHATSEDDSSRVGSKCLK